MRPSSAAAFFFVCAFWACASPTPEPAPSIARGALDPAPLTFNGGSATESGVPAGEWRYYAVEVPSDVTLLGWDVRLTAVTGNPVVVVQRGSAPTSAEIDEAVLSGGDTWPDGVRLAPGKDLSGAANRRRFTVGIGAPLTAGSYVVGVYAVATSTFFALGFASWTRRRARCGCVGIGPDQSRDVGTF